MDRLQRIEQVSNEIQSTIERVCYEYKVTTAEMVGILELCKLDLYWNLDREDNEDGQIN